MGLPMFPGNISHGGINYKVVFSRGRSLRDFPTVEQPLKPKYSDYIYIAAATRTTQQLSLNPGSQ